MENLHSYHWSILSAHSQNFGCYPLFFVSDFSAVLQNSFRRCKICHGKGFSESSSSPVAQEGCTYTELIRSFGGELWTSFAVSKSSWYSHVCQDLSCNITIMSLLAAGPARGFPLWMIVTTECGMMVLGTQEDIYHYDHVTTFLFLIHHSQVHQVSLLL